MTQVVLENLNPVVVEKLQILAQKHNRSLSEEIEVILEQVTSASQSDSEATRAAFRERLEEARLAHGNHVFSDSVDLLREDRQR
jgi:antitoxin FitA